MQPANTTLSDLYTHHRHQDTSQYYSYFPSQNPNPYPLHQQRHLQIESQYSSAAINPDPPGSESYLPSYSISHAGGAYNALHASALTYAQTITAAPPPTYASDLLVQNWVTEESVQPYGSALYATAGLIGQDSSQQLLTSIPSGWTNPSAQQPRGPWKKIPKKTKIAQSAWCEICKIECNTKDILYKHKLGKKHIKNIEKLNTAASLTFGTTSTSNPNPIIGPLENPKNLNPNLIPKKKKVETPQELEMKRRKVVEGGASVNAVRTCTICNVVCNSDTVFRFHLGGQKHISMLKKSHQGSGTV
ncbi:uncharacterized protein LOC111920075 [Lactuca sativa]|uniref:U1-type domain-containing protein n=1 Tax=Lactuca sativa TaxID=4236 RepID=A0A9R1WGX0_LACSA|nr:uncharacterized protein LOC111920075 [Lactuca sativa]KAJ0223648.1 hypothetical protein LSAT_V11C200082450 [Lactuca sativa]